MRLRDIVGWASVLVLMLVLLWTSWKGPDIFYHLALGRAVVETGTFQPSDTLLIAQPAYCNVYWLFQVVLWGIWSVGGVVGTSLLFVGLWLGVAWLWARTTAAHRLPTVGLPLALVVVLVVQQRFDPRPEVVSYLLLAAQLGWLSRWQPERENPFRMLVLFGLTEAIWVNVHGYFIFGPALVFLRLLAAIVGKQGRLVVRRVACLLGGTILATFVSPFGLGPWRFVVTLAEFLREMGSGIAEFGPPVGPFLGLWTVWLFWGLWVATVAVGVWLAVSRRLDPFAGLLAGLGLVLSATSVRNLPVLPILAAVMWRDALAELKLPTRRPRTRVVVPLAVGAAAITLAVTVVNGGFFESLATEREFGVGLRSHAFPIRVAGYLGEHGGAGRVFNNAADGGFLELEFPELRVCMDSRYIESGPVSKYFTALSDPVAFGRLDDELHFDAALLKVVDSGRVVVDLLRDPAWSLVWGDLHRVLLVRKTSPLARQWPSKGLHLDGGDDLEQRVNGMAAIQWAAILIESGDRELFVRALRQLDEAGRGVPSFVVQYALQYALVNSDREVLTLARNMAPRLIALAPEHRRAVEKLLAAARNY